MGKHFTKETTIDEILKAMDNNRGNTEIIHAGHCFLQYKLQQELLGEQNKYNKKQLCFSRWLIFATWALVIVNLFIVILN